MRRARPPCQHRGYLVPLSVIGNVLTGECGWMHRPTAAAHDEAVSELAARLDLPVMAGWHGVPAMREDDAEALLLVARVRREEGAKLVADAAARDAAAAPRRYGYTDLPGRVTAAAALPAAGRMP